MHQFIFNSKHRALRESASYGLPCIERVVRAIENLSPMPTTRLIWGDANASRLCYKLAEFKIGGPVSARKPGGVVSRSDEYRYQPDNDLFKLVVCDLAESLSESPSTVSEDILFLCLAQGTAWMVGASHLSDEQALAIDKELTGFPPYIGMACIDLGNPAQRDVVYEGMIHSHVVLAPHGIIYRAEPSLPLADQKEALCLVKEKGSSKPPIGLEWEAFAAILPPILIPDLLSERGELTARRIDGKSTISHRERLAAALLNRFDRATRDERIEFSTIRDEGVSEFEFPPRKFTEYLLNVDHPEGGAKAKFFTQVLGIEPQDWEFLADQFRRGVADAPIYRAGKNEWGFSHGALVFITGRNGNSAVVETGWHMKSGSPARFVTAYPYDRALESLPTTIPPFIVSTELVGDARWEAIFVRADAAGRDAASKTQPTPIIVEGFGTEWEGMCGFGWAHLPNARHPMAKWLLRTERGGRAYPGVTVWSPMNTQSLDRNRAWAEAFAEVLKANGVTSTAQSRID